MAQIEVFVAGTFLCEDVIKLVNKLACSKCEIIVHDLNITNATSESKERAKSYGIRYIPAVVLNGKVKDIEAIQKVNKRPDKDE